MRTKPKLKPGTIVRWVSPTGESDEGAVIRPGDLGVVLEYDGVPERMCNVHYFASSYGEDMWTLLHEVEPVEVDDA